MKIIDNFYSDMTKVKELLNSDFKTTGCGVGVKSPPLEQLDLKMYSEFREKLFDIHGLSGNLNLITYFTLYEHNPIEQLNKYCAHIDGRSVGGKRVTVDRLKIVVCGQIFLSENADPQTGITFYEPKPELKWSKQQLIDNALNDYLVPKHMYNSGKIDLEKYTEMFNSYHDQFNKVAFVDNVYNRMVSWDAGIVNSSCVTKTNKIVQNFYIETK